jgi:hypothetical protein
VVRFRYHGEATRRELCSANQGLGFALSPSSTRRRMASERPGPSDCFEAQSSTATEISGGSLTALTGCTPPFFFGRPMAFLFTEIDFFILSVYRKDKPRGSVNFRPGSNPSQKGLRNPNDPG